MSADTQRCPSEETLIQLAQGELPEPDRTRIKSHLEACAHCAALSGELHSLEEISRGLAAAPLNQRDRERIGRWTDSVRETLSESRRLKTRGPRP